MTTIHLDPAMVPAALRGAYSGKTFKAVVCEKMCIPADAGLWSGGSRDQYSAIEFASGREIALPGQQAAPWDAPRRERYVPLQPGFAIVLHSIFCGKDMGLTFYVHPDNATKLLPAPVEITDHEKLVLIAARNFKSSYMGRDRYDMMREEFRASQVNDWSAFPTRAQWDAAKAALAGRKLLTAAGAITPAGRNAIQGAR